MSIKRRQTFSTNETTLSMSASLGSLISPSPGFAPDGAETPGPAARAKKLFLHCRILALQAGDLGLQRRALVGHHLAGPAGVAAAALRDLPAAGVEAQHAVGHGIEAVAAVFAIGRRGLRRSGREAG